MMQDCSRHNVSRLWSALDNGFFHYFEAAVLLQLLRVVDGQNYVPRDEN